MLIFSCTTIYVIILSATIRNVGFLANMESILLKTRNSVWKLMEWTISEQIFFPSYKKGQKFSDIHTAGYN